MAIDLYSAQQYTKRLEGFKSYINKVKPSDDYSIVKERLLESIDIMLFYIEDLTLSMSKTLSDCVQQKTLLHTFKNTITASNNKDDLVMVTSLLDLLNPEPFKSYDRYKLCDEASDLDSNYKDYFQLDFNYLRNIRKTIANKKVNVFSPNCFQGHNAKNFKNEDDVLYGQTAIHVNQARENLDRIAKGFLKGSVISNNFFDVLLITSQVGYVEEKDKLGVVKEPKERTEIKNTLKYLRPDGLLIMTIPYTRLHPTFAMYLSKNLSNVQVVKYPGDDKLKRITILGTKNVDNKTSDPEIYRLLKLFDYNKAQNIEDINENYYCLPTEELVLEYFRGSELDITDVRAASDDNMLSTFINSQTDPLVLKDQSPLLPFSIGQVGLVLTSGCLDGVIEEMEGINHVIKGMTTKIKTTTREDLDDSKIKCTETISNQVKINVFTADGKYIELG